MNLIRGRLGCTIRIITEQSKLRMNFPCQKYELWLHSCVIFKFFYVMGSICLDLHHIGGE